MSYYLRYTLKLEEPVKMGTHSNQNNTEALSYIAGSTLRGALIALYQKKNTNVDIKELLKNVYFTDAYLSVNEKALLPVPAVYYADKHVMRSEEEEQKDKDEKQYTVHSWKESNEEGMQRVDFGGFCEINGDTFETHSVKKVGQLHIKVEEDKNERGLFRYEAIQEGQAFTAFIRCESQDVRDRFVSFMHNEILYLGGSKGSGYGRVSVEDVNPLEDYNAVVDSYHVNRQDEGTLTIYALSNLNLLDSKGQVTGEIETEWLAKKLGIRNLKCTYAATSINRTGGFNHTWLAGVVQNTVVAAGSFFEYTYEGTIDSEALKTIEENGVGLRRQEGFGRILFNPDFRQSKKVVHKHIIKPIDPPVLNEAEAKTLQQIQNIVNRNRIDAEILFYVNESVKSLNKRNLGMTQMSKLYNFLSSLLESALEEEKTMKRISGFFDDMKKLNKFNDKKTYKNNSAQKAFSFDNVVFDGKHYSFEDLLMNVDNGKGLEEWFPAFNELQYWGERQKSISDLEMKLRFLEQLVHAYMRKEGNKK